MGSGGKRAEGNCDTSSPDVINSTQPITTSGSKMQFNTMQAIKKNQTIVEFNIRLNSKDELNNLISKLKQESKITDVFRTAN